MVNHLDAALQNKGAWLGSRDERVLSFGFFHSNGESTG